MIPLQPGLFHRQKARRLLNAVQAIVFAILEQLSSVAELDRLQILPR